MNEEKSFLDRRTIIAVVVMTVIWIGWQSYMSKKYGSGTPAVATAPQEAKKSEASEQTQAATTKTEAPTQPSVAANPVSVTEESIRVSDDQWSFDVSNFGMAIRNVELKNYKDREGKPIRLATAKGDFATSLIGTESPLVFQLSREGNKITGVASHGGIRVTKVYTVESAKYLISASVKYEGMEAGVSGLRLSMVDTVKPLTGSFLMPSMELQSVYVAHGTSNTRKTLAPDGKGDLHEKLEAVSVASLGSLYFASAVVDSSEILPSVKSVYQSLDGQPALGLAMDYVLPSGLAGTTLEYKAFIGPKEIKLLQSIDSRLENLIDYWIVGALAKPMLKLMLWIQTHVGNWGLAIIILTLIIRTLVLPLYVSSFKSMKAMQKIQPQMQAIRTKYAEDPQKMNQEVMKLFKENKVNPLGGCLPMLLQLPIFIALYRVLSQSIELYQAPFILWIQDLSLKDPFFVLPVLMGISMFIQQKITPMSTTDPMQQKIMLWMPVIFSAMMLTLPSGLTLYIFVSTVYGIVQHYIFMKEKAPSAVPAKA